jgi:HD-like signal output (HDOD) protein
VPADPVATFGERLRDLLDGGRDFPALPESVVRVQALGEDPAADAGALARIVEGDPALRGRFLRAANSPYFRREGAPAASAAAAVSRLGVGQVRALCLALGADRAVAAGGGAVESRPFWAHSAAVGMAAQRLWALAGGAGPATAADLFVAGLLHDVGILLLERHFPAELQAAQAAAERSGMALWRAEASVLGMDHGAVGAQLLERWRVAAPACAAVQDHHHPGAAAEALQGAARCLHTAEALSGSLGAGLAIEGPPDLSPPEVLARAGVRYEQRVALGTALEQVRAAAPGFIAPS